MSLQDIQAAVNGAQPATSHGAELLDELEKLPDLTKDPKRALLELERLKPEMLNFVNVQKNPISLLTEPVRKKLGITADDLKKALRVPAATPDQSLPKEEPPTPEEIARADEILSADNLLVRAAWDLKALGLVGEEANAQALFLASISSQTQSPINVTVKAESSAGKNFLVESVCSLLPPEWVRSITAMTRQAIFFSAEDAFKHKLVIIAEAPGAEGADYSVRTMQSEGKTTLLVPQKGEDGKIHTDELTVEGPTGFIVTTTRAHLHAENETRTVDLFLDEGQKQTRDILLQTGRNYSAKRHDGDSKLIRRSWHVALQSLKRLPVVIPFADQLAEKFPDAPLRARRDFPKLLDAIAACALLHQGKRPRTAMNGSGEHILATLEDYRLARNAFSPALGRSLRGATEKCVRLVNAAKELIDKSGETGGRTVTKAALVDQTKWSDPTVRKYAREAVDLGCLEPLDGGGRGGKNHPSAFRFIRKVSEVRLELPEPREMEAPSASVGPGQGGPGACVPPSGFSGSSGESVKPQ